MRALGLLVLLVTACGHSQPPPETPSEPPPAPTPVVPSANPPQVAATPDAGADSGGPGAEAKKRRVLDLMQGKVPDSELKVDSTGE